MTEDEMFGWYHRLNGHGFGWTPGVGDVQGGPGMLHFMELQTVDSLEKTDAGRGWGQEEKGTTEDEMAGWHHRLDGHESE